MKIKDITEGSIRGGVWTSDPPDKGKPDIPPPNEPDDGILNRPAPRPVKPKPNIKPSTPNKPNAKPGEKPDPALGTIKNGVWTSDPPKKGEKGVPIPVPMDEAYSEELEQLRSLAFGK
ncbi:MAG: hypothetical protein RLZZ196_488 [Bacteroidota bacterium]|jgi:hypothetical protein